MEIGAFIDMSNRAETPGELFTQFRGAMAARGFDRVLFALMTDHVTINRKAQHGVQGTQYLIRIMPLSFFEAWGRASA